MLVKNELRHELCRGRADEDTFIVTKIYGLKKKAKKSTKKKTTLVAQNSMVGVTRRWKRGES